MYFIFLGEAVLFNGKGGGQNDLNVSFFYNWMEIMCILWKMINLCTWIIGFIVPALCTDRSVYFKIFSGGRGDVDTVTRVYFKCKFQTPSQVCVLAMVLRWPSRPVGLLFGIPYITTDMVQEVGSRDGKNSLLCCCTINITCNMQMFDSSLSHVIKVKSTCHSSIMGFFSFAI